MKEFVDSTKRIEFIDIAKGIGIILVVIGHNVTNKDYLWQWIYSFHMPLFFMLSGLCYTAGKHLSLKDFLTRKISSLILPYIFFSILQFLVFYFVLESISLKSIIKVVLFGWGNNPLWFLPILFLVELSYYLINETYYGKLIWGIILLIFVYAITTNKVLIYNINTVPWYLIFYGFAATFSRLIIKIIHTSSMAKNIIIGAIFFLVHFIALFYTTIYYEGFLIGKSNRVNFSLRIV